MYAEPEFDTSSPERESQEWRDEVASRLNSYRARRRRKQEGNQSMRLDFESEPVETEISRAAIVSRVAEKYANAEGVADTSYYRRMNTDASGHAATLPDEGVATEPELQQAEPWESDDDIVPPDPEDGYTIGTASAADIPIVTYDPENDPDFDFNRPRPEVEPTPPVVTSTRESRRSAAAARKLIHFPRPNGMEPPAAPPVYDFAEPVLDGPRILDVPEDTMPTIRGPLFADVHLDDPQTDEHAAAKFPPEIEVPLQVAALSQRIFSALIDALIVVIAYGIFVVTAWNVLPEIPRTKATALLAMAIPGVLWFVYQFLFIVYAGQTTGMQMAQLRLRTFDGRQPSWQERRHRALAMLLSCISVGLGFAWAMVDEDTLCWHDKISRTYSVQGR